MTENACSFESDTANAVRTGEWSGGLRRHVTECGACQETRAVAAFMGRVARQVGQRDGLPDPSLLWLRAALSNAAGESRRERRIRLWLRGLSGFAVAVTAWAALEWIPPAIALMPETLALSAAAIALTLGILYFASFRPLSNAGS